MTNGALLVVDDDPAVLRTTELILQLEGYAISVASNAEDAFRLLNSQYFNLILLDCIPDRGWVVQEARRLNPLVRIAVCTGNSEIGDLPLVDVVLHKPLSVPLLLATIANLLGTANAA